MPKRSTIILGNCLVRQKASNPGDPWNLCSILFSVICGISGNT